MKYLFVLSVLCTTPVLAQQQEEKRVEKEKQELTIPREQPGRQVPENISRNVPTIPQNVPPVQSGPQPMIPLRIQPPIVWNSRATDCWDVPLHIRHLCMTPPRYTPRSSLRDQIRHATPQQRRQIQAARRRYKDEVQRILRRR